MRSQRIGLLVAVGLLTALCGSAAAGPRTVSETYDVTGVPGAMLHPLAPEACGASQEGVHKTTRPLRAPFSGWLSVELTGVAGDWDVALTDPAGHALAFSSGQFYGTGDELLAFYAVRGADLRIVACNYAGGPSGRVTYRLVEGPSGVKPQRDYRELRLELPYESPAAGARGWWGLCHVGFGVGCAATAPPAWARYVQVSVADAVSPAVAAQLYSYAGDTYNSERDFCTAIDESVPLQPRTDWVGVVVLNGPCLDGTPAQATRGKVTFIFTTHAVPR